MNFDQKWQGFSYSTLLSGRPGKSGCTLFFLRFSIGKCRICPFFACISISNERKPAAIRSTSRSCRQVIFTFQFNLAFSLRILITILAQSSPSPRQSILA